MATGVCRLCEKPAELKESHLIPKFVFAWMKETGSPYLRMSGRPNKREQDGRKYHLLCGVCEQRFSTREGWFSQNMFVPYLEQKATSFPYTESLYYFLVSVLWRVLQDDLGDLPADHPHHARIHLADYEWRTYLLGGPIPPTYNDVHLYLTDLDSGETPQPVVNYNRYFTRAVDHTVAHGPTRCFAYAKFARFLIFSGISGLDPSQFVGTRVFPVPSVLSVPQELRDVGVYEFMLDRARSVHAMMDKGTSPKQKQVIADAFKQDAARILGSDLGTVLKADFGTPVDPTGYWPPPGGDEDCTCGSGKPYKECHGR